ncbi:MAG: Deoxycytidine triphosphate deaminase [Phycisphaerales bacterium]|nr:Deoxycytidine triphosphate deaminase [Phycisphaerales bacterium]
MSFWGTERFRKTLSQIVPDGDPARVKQGSYELSLGHEAYLSGERQKQRLNDGELVTIPPGATALLLTKEFVSIPHNAVGLISLKSSVKLPGLVNVSGFHVDPGFTGRLVFTVFNAGVVPQPLQSGDALFLLWLADMDEVPDPYSGPRARMSSIPADLIGKLTTPGVSPADLQKKIDDVQQHIKHEIDKVKELKMVVIGLLAALLVAAVTLILEGFPWSRLGQRLGDWVVPSKEPTSAGSTPSPGQTGSLPPGPTIGTPQPAATSAGSPPPVPPPGTSPASTVPNPSGG